MEGLHVCNAVSSMPGLFSFMQHPRVRQSSSSSTPQPPRAQTAENQAGPAPIAPAQGTATRQGQASGDAGHSALDADRELQQALEASELEEALAHILFNPDSSPHLSTSISKRLHPVMLDEEFQTATASQGVPRPAAMWTGQRHQIQYAQPLYNQILGFYQRMGMALPEKPPLMMVESSALNDAEEREGRSGGGHSHGPVFHTRGLTLTVEYSAIQQVVTRDGRRFTQPVDLSDRDRFEVTAILVLYGLPWLLTGTILAHECMHAWLRLRGITRLPLQTEEGLCQLMGLLWLESQDLSKQQGTWEERLASYFAHQIRTDPSSVYGDGFKLALEAYQNLRDLPALIAHVARTGQFPV
ncbi:hypothetical protein WJX79_001731 [Trebouxia sp. C0005]